MEHKISLSTPRALHFTLLRASDKLNHNSRSALAEPGLELAEQAVCSPSGNSSGGARQDGWALVRAGAGWALGSGAEHPRAAACS